MELQEFECHRRPMHPIEELAKEPVVRQHQQHFAQITGAASGVLPLAPDKQWFGDPVNHCEFCKLVRTTKLGRELCLRSDRGHLDDAARDGHAVYRCEAGLWDMVAPIRVSGFNSGWLLGGQCHLKETEDDSARLGWERHVREIADKIGVNPDELWQSAQATNSAATREELDQLAQQLRAEADALGKACWIDYARRVRDELWQRLGRELSPEGVREVAFDAVERLFGKVSVAILLPEGGEMVAYATRRVSADVKPLKFAPGKGFIGWTALYQLPVLDKDSAKREWSIVQDEEHRDTTLSLPLPQPAFENVGSNSLLRSALTVPLGQNRNGLCEGVLQIGSNDPEAFDVADVEPLKWIGEPVLEASKRTRRFQEVYNTCTEKTEEQRRLKALLSITVDTLEAEWGEVYVLNRDGIALELVTAQGPLETARPLAIRATEGITGRVVREGTTLIAEDLSEDVGYRDAIKSYENTPYGAYLARIRSAVVIPLRDSSYKILGVVFVGREEARPFHLARIAEAENLAGLCSQVLERWCFHGHEKELALHERLLLSGRGPIATADDRQIVRQEVIALALEMLKHTTPARHVSVWRHDDQPGMLTCLDANAGFPLLCSPLLSLDKEFFARRYRAEMKKRGVPTEVVWFEDVVVDGQPVYSLVIDSEHRLGFSNSTKDALKRLADRISLVITNVYNCEVEQFTRAIRDEVEKGGHDLKERIGEAACPRAIALMGAQGGSLWMRDEEGKHLIFVAGNRDHSGESYARGEGATGWIWQRGQCIRVRNLRDPNELREVAPDLVWAHKYADDPVALEIPVPFLGVPVRSAGGVEGVLRVSALQEGAHFTVEDEICLAMMARCVGELWAAAVRMEFSEAFIGLAALDQHLNQPIASPKDIANIALDFACQVGGFSSGHLRVYDRARAKLVLLATRDEDVTPTPDVLPGRSLSGRVFDKGQPWFIDDTSQNDNVKRAVAEDERRATATSVEISAIGDWLSSARTVAVLPVRCGREVLATISLHRANVSRIAAREKECLMRIADRVALALKILQQGEEQKKFLLPFLGSYIQLTELLADTETADDRERSDIEERLFSVFHEMIGLSDTVAYLADPQLKELRRYRAIGRNAAALPETVTIAGNDLTETFVELTKPLIIEDPSSLPGYAECLCSALKDVKTAVVVPLLLGGEYQGLVAAFDTRRRRYDRDGKRRVTALLRMGAHILVTLLERNVLRTPWQTAAQLGQLLAGLIHEFANVGKTVSPGLSVLERLDIRDECDKQQLEMLKSGLRDLQRYTEDLGQLKNGQLQQHVRLDSELRSAIVRVRGDRRVPIDFDGPGQEISVLGSSLLLRNAFRLVLMNATDAFDPGVLGRIKVALCVDHKNLVATVVITDTGRGMTDWVLRNVFRPGFTTKNEGTHSGMGLAAARAIVTLHRGKIAIDSMPHEGTTVTMTFPTN